IGLFLLVFCTSILIPLPATNTVPGIAVAIVGFGLLAKDGLLILPGLALGSAWVTGLILVGERITDVIRNLLSGIS
ncbi:MAG: exopolysaccharide biosynthesis protein, partial [Pseudomonadota bacterium]